MPYMCLLFGVLFSFAALTFGFGWKLDFVTQDDLKRVRGVVRSVHHTNLPKAGSKIHIYIQNSSAYHHLTQDDLTWKVPALRTLRPGDSVVAYIKPDSLGRDLDWLWRLDRDAETILSYEQVRDYLLGKAARDRPLAYASSFIAFALLVTAMILRKHFGSWTSAT